MDCPRIDKRRRANIFRRHTNREVLKTVTIEILCQR
jgi:hypothetical protein